MNIRSAAAAGYSRRTSSVGFLRHSAAASDPVAIGADALRLRKPRQGARSRVGRGSQRRAAHLAAQPCRPACKPVSAHLRYAGRPGATSQALGSPYTDDLGGRTAATKPEPVPRRRGSAADRNSRPRRGRVGARPRAGLGAADPEASMPRPPLVLHAAVRA